MKVVTIVGARPQFVKAAVVSRALRADDRMVEVLVHTGQHYDDNMSAVFFRQMEIPEPEYHLGVGSGLHGAQTGRMLASIEEVLLKEEPDVVMVYGDTNSTLAGALAAAKLHVPVAHVEAGLRSHNRRMPEELNRVLTDHVSDYLFVPTQAAAANLRREGIGAEHIYFTGDVMYDAVNYYGAKAEKESRILRTLGLESGHYVLTTIHRAENTDSVDRLTAIIEGLSTLGATGMKIVLPLHPRTAAILRQSGLWDLANRSLCIIEPVGYFDMLMLEQHAKVIATDSGGVQKEAFFFRVPCVTLRDETEWGELVELGWNRIVRPTEAIIVAHGISQALVTAPGGNGSPYGDGNSAQLIIRRLLGE